MYAGLLTALLLSAAPLRAQCPDGTPPPCGPRRAVTLDERTWLVVPFENLARAPKADLIRQASANLVVQELSRWKDLRVVPEERSADLLAAEARARPGRSAFEWGLAAARRAGAGKLLLGDYLAVSGRAQVTAKVYDVRTGRQERIVRDQLSGLATEAGLDSLMAIFARLAHGAVALPESRREVPLPIGTRSLAAYRAYVTGTEWQFRGRRDSAAAHLLRAVAMDSAFAMAHLRLSEVLWLQPPLDSVHFYAALRHAEGLPEHLRLGVTAAALLGERRWAEGCAVVQRLAALDSLSANVWRLRARCEIYVRWVRPSDGAGIAWDSTPGAPGGSLAAAERYLRRAIEMGSWQALNDLVAILLKESPLLPRHCTVGASCGPGDFAFADVRLVDDTLALRWYREADANARVDWGDPRSPRRLAERARDLARTWVTRYPTLWYGRVLVARTSLALGDLQTADRELVLSAEVAQLPGDRAAYYRSRISILVALERPAEARLLLDSLYADSIAQVAPQYHTAFGRFSRDRNVSYDPVGPDLAAWFSIFAGALPASFEDLHERVIAASRISSRLSRRALGNLVAFHQRRWAPAADTASGEPIQRFQAWLTLGDTARARGVLTEWDGRLSARRDSLLGNDGSLLFAAESHLALGDSVRALERLASFGRNWRRIAALDGVLLVPSSIATSPGRLWGRTWLLYGDLAMAAGRRDEARRAYRMVVGFWEHGEPPVQPMAARARAALVQLAN